ncbi:MAG TPA: flagellar biosynthesis protein FlaG [Lachnospiraceae bacterium]|nr:flagellar protein FlaG [Lachnospiraceae bacterium]MDD7664112.1 flagellar protein FlaG [Lachnospiraceae bacterium]MDY4165334.1 flagellar protein FlaG [Lachnospiraceae bacterium]HAP03886.1 flagellar biosynthesis protein FlaG [Lachnospiraceae bacterium]
MEISVNAGYSKQGSYSVGSAQTGNVDTSANTASAAEPEQAAGTSADAAVRIEEKNAFKQASDLSAEYDKKLDEKENEQIKKAVSEINKHANGTEAIFGIHDKTNRVTIKIVDRDTKKVIKEFPPEKTLDMIAKVWELAGLLVDEKK